MQKQYLNFKIKKATDDSITIVASDETLDRMGEVIPLDSWDLKNYKKNPVLLVDHDYKVSNIVGRAKNLIVDREAMTFQPDFHEITELARNVRDMVKSDFAPAVSVGFIPHGPKKDGEKGTNELLEISFVAVPANPNALSMAMKSIDESQVKQIEEWVEKEEKQNETTEIQTVLCSKEKFTTSEEAATWCKEHDFRADKTDETDEYYRFRQFDPSRCQDGSERTIDITDGVKGVICRPKKGLKCANCEGLIEDVETKEGRVLSGRTRTLITESVSALKQAAALLDELLLATESNTEKSADTKGREPKVEREKLNSVVRVLQDINRVTNDSLNKIKR